jgi:hypothetical protein
MKKTYHGSCHCGAVRFECAIDLSEMTSKCNCSICTKTRFWKAIAKANEFRLLQGQDALSDYQFGSNTIHHFFCKHCGVKTFGRGHLDLLGGDFYAVSVVCLDDATAAELGQAPVRFEDGRNNKWESPPAEIRHL